jgi:hypothetical protein
LYKVLGQPAHIAVSVVGVFVLAAYTALTKKTWKIPALEIAMRLCYGVALITGIVVMNVEDIIPLEIAHRAFAALFAVLLIVLFVIKAIAQKKSK